ncbi:MAG: hypothetical protein KGH60_05160 [Candidatus Micrarchaeota archaeon]|nr:hypothetical protein [Candidatus Micrarchaeota archaeon]
METVLNVIDKKYRPLLRDGIKRDEILSTLRVDDTYIKGVAYRLLADGFVGIRNKNVVLALPEYLVDEMDVFDSRLGLKRSQTIKRLELEPYYLYLTAQKGKIAAFIRDRFYEKNGKNVGVGERIVVSRLMHRNGLHWPECVDESDGN